MNNKTRIVIGEVVIESDGFVDLEIEGNVIRIKGKTTTIPVVMPYPVYANPYMPIVQPTWLNTTTGTPPDSVRPTIHW